MTIPGTQVPLEAQSDSRSYCGRIAYCLQTPHGLGVMCHDVEFAYTRMSNTSKQQKSYMAFIPQVNYTD
jgi:hypothetical protein